MQAGTLAFFAMFESCIVLSVAPLPHFRRKKSPQCAGLMGLGLVSAILKNRCLAIVKQRQRLSTSQ